MEGPQTDHARCESDLPGGNRCGGAAELDHFEAQWGKRYPAIGQAWRRAWEYVVPLFAFPAAIRKMIYTNAVESLHRSLRKIIKTRGSFPTDEAALKLAIRNAGVKWRRRVEWTAAMGQFAICLGVLSLQRAEGSKPSDAARLTQNFGHFPAGPRIEIDDAYAGGERSGEGSGRGRRGHTPFIAAIETSDDGRPLHARLQVVRGFRAGETRRLCAGVAAGTTVVSDGGQWFRCIAEQPGIIHERHVTGSGRAAARHPAFRWANTVLANVKNSLLATHRVVGAKHLPRYLGAFAWRFNRRFVLKTIHERLAVAATTTPPMPYRLLKLAEARW